MDSTCGPRLRGGKQTPRTLRAVGLVRNHATARFCDARGKQPG